METILIVDDINTNIEILLDQLEDDYDIIVSKDGEGAIEIAKEDKPNLILLDIMMPGMDGFEVCRRLKADNNTKDIPIIFLTAKTDDNSIETAYDIGGNDYVTKPFRQKELKAKVKRELKLQKLQNELKHLALTDPMTKLYNRRYFTQISENMFKLTKRDQKELSLVLLDIDKFKNINDTYGHSVGDEIIIKFSQVLQENQRKSDITFRFGGEEFVVLLPETNKDGALFLANKIRTIIEDLNMQLDCGEVLRFTASLGVASVVMDDENIEKALSRADMALYEAKNSGRNRVCIG